MNVFESFAHALLQEHGRSVFGQQFYSSSYGIHGYATTFWKNALLSYGQKFYMLPRLMGIKEPEKGTYGFPAFTVAQSLELGIPLPEMLMYKTMGGYDHQYTPIHLATGLHVFGHGIPKSEAEELLQVTYMKKLWPKRTPQDFASQSAVNPYTPEMLGFKPYTEALLRQDPDDPESPYVIIDELGNAAWFPLTYTKNIVKTVDAELWFHTAWTLSHVSPRLAELKPFAAYPLLQRTRTGRRWRAYEGEAKYSRAVTLQQFMRYFGDIKGVSRSTGCFRSDVDSETMAVGLRVLAASDSASMEKAFQFIGRPLTYGDLKELTATHVLEILRCCNYETVRGVIETHSEELSALLFRAPANLLKLVSDCMNINLESRAKNWYPDTIEGNHDLLTSTKLGGKKYDPFLNWQTFMQPKMAKYVERRVWRDRLLSMADPDVAFLALTYCTAQADSPVPVAALRNVLLSHPNIGPILEHVQSVGAFASSL